MISIGCPGAIFALAGIGAAGGAAAGWGLDGAMGNRVVFENPKVSVSNPASKVKIASERTPEFFGRIASGVTPNFTSPHISASGGFALRWASGISTEIEFGHTLKGVVHPNTCMAVSPTCCPCALGVPFDAGLKSLGTAAAQVRYTYARWRVQPFVSGGYAILSTKANSSINVQSTTRSTAIPLGAGFRMPLTQSISVRPEVTFFAGDEQLMRAAVGIVYHWK